MTLKLNDQIAIITAYKYGKIIERRRYGCQKWETIDYLEDYLFDFLDCEYRIKQESEYRPFETTSEAFQEAKKHGFLMKCKDDTQEEFVWRLKKEVDAVNANKDILYINFISSDKVLQDYVWADDGSPCGMKID